MVRRKGDAGLKTKLDLVKDMVEGIIKNDIRARSDDKWLIWRVLQHYGIFIPFEKFERVPAFESITRGRRKLQEDGNYPADEKAQERREEAEESYKGWSQE